MSGGNVVPMRAALLAAIMGDPAAAGLPFNPAARGYVPQYHAGHTNHCPGCGRVQWLVGRLTAECAFCGTALPIVG